MFFLGVGRELLLEAVNTCVCSLEEGVYLCRNYSSFTMQMHNTDNKIAVYLCGEGKSSRPTQSLASVGSEPLACAIASGHICMFACRFSSLHALSEEERSFLPFSPAVSSSSLSQLVLFVRRDLRVRLPHSHFLMFPFLPRV